MKIPKDFLSQVNYKDDNGKDILANKVDVVTIYKIHGDGFYTWVCAECGNQENSRSCGWATMGQVLECKKCKSMNLLLWNGTDDLQKGLQFAREYEDQKSVVEAEREKVKIAEEYVLNMRRDISFIFSSLNDIIHNWLDHKFWEKHKEISEKYKTKKT